LSPITIKSVLTSATARLTEAGCNTPLLDAEVLLAHTLGKNRTWLIVHRDDSLSSDQAVRFTDLIQQRVRRTPVAYITGVKEFYGLEFRTTPQVLIPRPETELLVETALQMFGNRSSAVVVDVGTGSGCIAITLARQFPQFTILATDLSEEALDVARQNASQHLTDVSFYHGHLLTPVLSPVDFVVSNPPYVSTTFLEAGTTMPEVSYYEPRLALDGGHQGLDIITDLLTQAATQVKPDGAILIEIGFDQGSAVIELAKQHFPKAQVEVRTDLAGLDRLLVVRQLSF
jgi:release factor glutamine methyltransferase